MEHIKQLTLFLGLKGTFSSPLDLIDISRKGIGANTLKKILSLIHISQEEFSIFSGIKSRTLTRRFENTKAKLNPEETEKVIRLARIYLSALDVFKDEEKASAWLKRSNRALAHQIPLSLLDSDIGFEQVMITLGRISEGVYS